MTAGSRPIVAFVWRTRDGQRHEFELVDERDVRDSLRRFGSERFASERTRRLAWRAIVERAAVLGYSRFDGQPLDASEPPE